jgi:beta-N-acetylhexosaminidase
VPRLNDLDRDERIGQLLWIGFEGTALDATLRDLVHRVRPGGLILFGRNIEDARQVRALADDLYRSLRVPPFLAIDQEGGRVNRLRGILGAMPAPLSLARGPHATGAVRAHARATAGALKALGLNVNFAPVLDLSGEDAANGIGDRAYGEDPRRVALLAGAAVKEYLREGVIPVGKHFPGLGGARADTHLTLPVIRRPRSLLLRVDLYPYRRLRKTLPMVMVGHAYYPALQGGRPHPATLSGRIVDDLLRRRLGFRGLVLTDDLEMGAVDRSLSGADAARAAFAAGSDGLMFCRSAERIAEAHEGLARDLTDGRIDAARLNASLRRIRALKERLLRRRRTRFSRGSLARARLVLETLHGPAAAGADPTARE